MGLFGRSPLAKVLISKPDRWKGKKRDDSSAGASGSVVFLNLVGDGVYNAYVSAVISLSFQLSFLTRNFFLFYRVYTIPVTVGNASQQFSLQVDTGSSDLVRSFLAIALRSSTLTLTSNKWIAATSCSSTASGKPRLYDPSSSSIATGQSVDFTYLSGETDGPIVWDKFAVGGYEINNQAMGAFQWTISIFVSIDLSILPSRCRRRCQWDSFARLFRHSRPRFTPQLCNLSSHSARNEQLSWWCDFRLQSVWYHALIANSSLSALYNVVESRPLFLRERSNSYHSPTAWLLSRLFDVIPLQIIPTIIVASMWVPLNIWDSPSVILIDSIQERTGWLDSHTKPLIFSSFCLFWFFTLSLWPSS